MNSGVSIRGVPRKDCKWLFDNGNVCYVDGDFDRSNVKEFWHCVKSTISDDIIYHVCCLFECE